MCVCLTDKTPNKTSNKKKTTGNGASASVISLLFMHLPSGEGFKIIGVGGVIEDGHTEGISAIDREILEVFKEGMLLITTGFLECYAYHYWFFGMLCLSLLVFWNVLK